MKGFIDFIRSQGIIGLAIGFLLGGAVSKTVSAFVNSVINPLIGLLLGNFQDLGAYKWIVSKAEIQWGNFLIALIDFIIIAAVVYFIFKGLRIENLDKKKE